MRRIAVAAALLWLVANAPAAGETRLEAAYTVSLTGIPVGRASVNVNLSEDGYVVAGSAKTSGLVRLISKGRGEATVRGSFRANRVTSSKFTSRLNTRRRQEKIELSVVNGAAKDILVEPPRDDDPARVPVTNKSRIDVIDPLSATLVFVPAKGDLLDPASCNRRLPIFDGRYRFDIVLSYVRTEQAPATTGGYQGPALVCQARYVPIAGHRAGRSAVETMAKNRDMFVWLAPIAGTRVLAPIRASIASPIGTFVVQATRFHATTK